MRIPSGHKNWIYRDRKSDPMWLEARLGSIKDLAHGLAIVDAVDRPAERIRQALDREERQALEFGCLSDAVGDNNLFQAIVFVQFYQALAGDGYAAVV